MKGFINLFLDDENRPRIVVLLGLYALAFSWPVLTEQIYFNHPDFPGIFYPFRHWFLELIKTGDFPLWNPYWGAGNPAIIWGTLPLDQFTLPQLLGLRPPVVYFLSIWGVLVSYYFIFRLALPNKRQTSYYLISILLTLILFWSPWSNYFLSYLMMPNAWIGYGLGLIATIRYFSDARYGKYIVLGGFISFLGTRPENWIFNLILLFLFLIAFGLSKYKSMNRNVFFRKIGGTISFYMLGMGINAWTLYLVISAAGQSYRVGSLESGLTHLFSASLYHKLWLSIQDSRLLILALIFSPLLFLNRVQGKQKIMPIAMTALLFFACWKPWIAALFKNILLGSVFWGGVLAFFVTTRRNRQFRHEVTWLLFIIPLFYWSRTQSEMGEMETISAVPFLFKFIFGFLVWMSLDYMRLKKDSLSYIFFGTVVVVFLMREQGLVILSHLTGAIWIPTRDNFYIEFAFALIILLAVTDRYHLLRPKLAQNLCVALILIFGALCILEPQYIHPLYGKPPNHDPYRKLPRVKKLLDQLELQPGERILFSDSISTKAPAPYGTSLLMGIPQISVYLSFINGPFLSWANFYQYGLDPDKKVFVFTMSERFYKYLPGDYRPSDIRNYDAVVEYLPHIESPTVPALATKYIISREANLEGFSPVLSIDGLTAYQTSNHLPFAFLVPTHDIPESATLAELYELPGSRPIFTERNGPNRLFIHFNQSTPSTLILSQSFDSNWNAQDQLSKISVEIKKVDIGFQKLRISPGRVLLAMNYWPKHLTLAIIISTFCFFTTVLLLTLDMRQRKRPAK